jgi:transcriptional regulator with XRE-family HTH domain
MNVAEIRERLIQLRLSKGCSARSMSINLGKSTNYIQNIESGKNMPSLPGFLEICDYLEVSPFQFFCFDESFEKISLHNEINSLSENEAAFVRHVIEGIKKYRD